MFLYQKAYCFFSVFCKVTEIFKWELDERSFLCGNFIELTEYVTWLGAVSDLSLISDLSQKFKHDLWRLKSKLKLSQKQHFTPGLFYAVQL